jgi:hypothetical protein
MLMRDIWQTSERSYGAYFGLAKTPKKLQITGIKSLIERAIRSQGLLLSEFDDNDDDNDVFGIVDNNSSRYNLTLFNHNDGHQEQQQQQKNRKNGRKMRPWKSIHGIRKTYKTITEQKMKPANIELLLGHKLGISSSYYKPNIERDILPDYLKVVDDLTINKEHRLSRQVQELQEKNKDKDYIIQGKLSEKDEQIKALQDSIKFLSDTVNRALLADPENKILDITTKSDGVLVKGIELKPQINNKAVGKIITSACNGNNRKK